MATKPKKPYWTNTRVTILSILVASVTTIIAAYINKKSSKEEKGKPIDKQEVVFSPHLDTGIQNNTNNQVKQENNNKGDVKNEFVSGNKTTTYQNKEVKAKNINNGTNNGIVGDVTVSEREFTPSDGVQIMTYVDTFYVNHNLKNKCFSLIISSSSNGQKFAAGLEKFLIGKGYTVESTGSVIGPSFKGVNIVEDMEHKCLLISIGQL